MKKELTVENLIYIAIYKMSPSGVLSVLSVRSVCPVISFNLHLSACIIKEVGGSLTRPDVHCYINRSEWQMVNYSHSHLK